MTETAGFALRCALHAVSDCPTASAQCVQGMDLGKVKFNNVEEEAHCYVVQCRRIVFLGNMQQIIQQLNAGRFSLKAAYKTENVQCETGLYSYG